MEKKGIIIIFIDAVNYKFGGYSENGWGDFGLKNDESNFIFSFNYKEKSKDKIAFDFSSYSGPNFKSHDYNEIYFNSSLDKGLTSIIEYDDFREINSKSIIFDNKLSYYCKREWNVNELEVFKITYI